jgi:competence ComEA-like helix-hairpin-helix protein
MKQNLRAGRGGFLRAICLSWLLIVAQAACVKLPRRAARLSGQNAPPAALAGMPGEPLININTATQTELEKLPGVGTALAARIVEHREKYGRFRRVEHLLAVRGISERRFNAMRPLLTTE